MQVTIADPLAVVEVLRLIRSSTQPAPSAVGDEPPSSTSAFVGLLNPPPIAFWPASHVAVTFCSLCGFSVNGTDFTVVNDATLVNGGGGRLTGSRLPLVYAGAGTVPHDLRGV
jgi:hypothetical protein